MNPQVCVQAAALPGGVFATLPWADKGLLSRVHTPVCLQVARLFEGIVTALIRTGIGSVPGVDSDMSFQVARLGKGAPTVIPGADMTFVLCRHSFVCFQTQDLARAVSAAFMEAGRAPFSCMDDLLVFFQDPAPGKGF